jgi:hypothetical protein
MHPTSGAGKTILALGAWLSIAGAGTLAAQTPIPGAKRELVGIVRDAKGAGIEGATIEILGSVARTDTKGSFRLFTPELDTATIAIRRPGFSPIEALISARNRQWDTVVVELEQLSQRLPGVRVEDVRDMKREGLKGFEERVNKGVSGLFITRSDIVERNSIRLSDVLQTRRGISLVKIGSNRYGVRFATYQGTRGAACIPDMWVDGQRARGMEIDDLPANTVEGIELYDSFSLVPFQFAHSANAVPCGTIVVWTRPPGTRRP